MAYYAQPSAETNKVLRYSAEDLEVTFYSAETATNVSTGSMTIGIVDEAGRVVTPAGTSTSTSSTGVYKYTLQAQTDLKRLTATWSGTFGTAMEFTTQHEVVGGFYATPIEVRNMDSINGESSTFPTADLVQAVTWAEAVIDDYCGTSFVYRYERDVLDGTGTDTIKLSRMFPRKIIAASIDGVALTTDEINNIAFHDSGVIVREDDIWEFTTPGKKVVIEYEAGYDKTPPPDIAWATRTLARYHLIEQVSRIPERALSISSEFGNIALSQPSMSKPTPLPDVNVILNRHRHRAPVAY
jgi:hypothetical protein